MLIRSVVALQKTCILDELILVASANYFIRFQAIGSLFCLCFASCVYIFNFIKEIRIVLFEGVIY